MEIDPALQAVWAIANTEACLSGSAEIRPIHFVLAVLKVLDDAFHRDAEQMGFSKEAISQITSAASDGRALLGLPGEKLTSARRRLRKALRANAKPGELKMLHRSEESRQLFRSAAKRANDGHVQSIGLLLFIESLLADLPKEAVPYLQGNETPEKDDPVAETTPLLGKIGRDVSALAREGRLATVVGRKQEMTLLARYLQRTSKRNVLLTGEAGVGKTAIVEGLAQRLTAEDAPEFLRGWRIIQVNVADLLAGTLYRGQMEERLQALLKEAISDPNLIVFFDEIHLVMKTGSGGGAMDIANILKPALARDDFRCIGATTTEEFERHIKSDSAFMRRFQILRVQPPSKDEALQVCREWARRIERIQEVVFEEEAIQASVYLSDRLVANRSLPDKAIDLLENAAVFVKVSSLSARNRAPSKTAPTIRTRDIEAVLEEQYGVSANRSEALSAGQLKTLLSEELVGQERAVDEVLEELHLISSRSEDRRNLGVFLFSGPTGVGKTLMAECLARGLFGSESPALARFSMSEYKERHELSRLTGAPPGFLGHDRQGALFKFVEEHPQGLILLDEMEKAHPEIQDYFLQLFDKGETMDSRGRKVSFARHLFVMTCNIQANEDAVHQIGFASGGTKRLSSLSTDLANALTKFFRQEFLARVDRIVSFQALNSASFESLFRRRFALLTTEKPEMTLGVSDEAVQQFCALCISQCEGVRGFHRLFERTVQNVVNQEIKALPERSAAALVWKDGRFSIKVSPM